MEEQQRSESNVLASRFRRLNKVWRVISVILPAAALSIGIIYVFHLTVFGRIMFDLAYLYLLLALFLPLVFIWIPAHGGGRKGGPPWYDVLLICISFAVPFYFFLRTGELVLRGWALFAPPEATVAAAVFWLVLIEISRRCVNLLFAVVILIFSTYPFYAYLMPIQMLRSTKISLTRIINFNIFSENSVIGIPVNTFGLIILGFMTFAIVIQIAGAGKLFNDISIALLGKTRGATAKGAVFSTSLFGMVSGSTVASVAAIGSFTIPAMRRAGFPPDFAAGVQASASAAGPLDPPIMGAAAFIMAEFLQMTYAEVCIAAIVPSFLYYLVLYAQIDAFAARGKMKSRAIKEAVPKIRWVLFDNLHIIAGAIVLVYVLFVLYWINLSPWIASGVVFALAMVRKKTRLYPRDFLNFIETAGRSLGQLAGILASVGMIIGAFIITGIAHSLPYSIVHVAAGNVYILLLLGAIAAFVLGLGVPIIATYIFLAITVAPGLVGAGLNPIAVHLFMLYWAVISDITPPVALCAFAAAAIAEADPMKTMFQAMRLGMAKYLVPFFFVLSPALVLQGTPLESLQVVTACAVGLVLMSGALEGYMWWIGTIGKISRVLFFAAGFLLAIPHTSTDLLGVGLAAALFLGHLLVRRRAKGKVVSVSQ